MISEKFRRQLRQESDKWRQEGLIDAPFYQQLSDRYQFSQIETAASNRFVVILLGLGGILLGLGMITFVAANWQEWPRGFRVFLLLSLFVGVNASGFYLWRRSAANPGLHRLGHGLLLAGALILGANMALMSQMFHQSGQVYELYFVWGLGVVAMAYSLRMTSLGVLAWILMSISYYLWFTNNWWWFRSSLTPDVPWISFLMGYMALAASLIFVPLAYWLRSRVMFGLAGIGFASFFVFGLRPLSNWQDLHGGGLAAIAFTLPPALLWAYDKNIWRFSRLSDRQLPAATSDPTAVDPFQAIARSLAVWFFSIVFYIFSFHWLWEDANYYANGGMEFGGFWHYLDVVFFLILAGLGWLRLGYRLRRLRVFQEKSVNNGAIASFVIITATLFSWRASLPNLPIIAPFLINLMLFLLAIALLRDGLALGARRTFWGGMVLLVLGILSRIFEYNTDLLLKSFVLVLCGVGVIAAGLWFERHFHPPASPPSANLPQEKAS